MPVLWANALYGVMRVERLSPPVASRLSAYAMTALYAGVAAAHPALMPLDGALVALPVLPRADDPQSVDATLVAVTAERVVLDSLLRDALPTTTAQIARLADSLAGARVRDGVSVTVQAQSDTLGRRIGALLVAWANADGFAGTRARAYVAPTGEGRWVNDAPANLYATQNLSGVSEFVALDNPANVQRGSNMSDRGLIMSRPKAAGARTMPAANMAGATEPYWNELRPFVLEMWNACPLPEPVAYARDSTSAMYREAQTVLDTARARTAEQRTIALYWADNAGESGTPVGHWLSIAAQMIGERTLDADQAVRLLLATSLAQADAFIAAWGYKYQYLQLRPRTYIRRHLDPAWEPLIPTPPFPEYPAGHSTQSAAAAAALTVLIGSAPFSDSTSMSIGHAVRSFASFQAASEEAGRSRVYAGVHFPSGNAGGLALGRCIGGRVGMIFTRPWVGTR